MTGDSENDARSAGEPSARPNPTDVGDTGARPFKSWASVYETEPSMWTRMRGRLSGLFSRRASLVDSGDKQAEVPEEKGPESVGVTLAQPEEFRFPWTPAGLQTPVPSGETFTSVDDALPTASDLAFVPQPVVEPNKPKFQENRIDAAAKALDAVSDTDFKSFDRPPEVAGARGFASVADALPDQPSAQLPALASVGEIETRTDEFEIITVDVLDPATKPGMDTLEVEAPSAWAAALQLFGLRKATVAPSAAEETEAARTSAIFLLAKFRAFYNEIIRFQHQRAEFSAGFATAMMADDGSDVAPDAVAEGLSKRLSELLELQAAEAKWMGGEAARYYPEAQYAMAALADEIFAYAEWEGQTAWSKYSLELKLHKMRSAELELFRRMDRLLKDAPDSVVARDLARVYLLVLAAGFQGKWRPFNLTRPIAEYRQRLYEYIHGVDALMIYAPDRKVFPDAVSRTLEGAAVARYSGAQRWAAILVFLVVTYAVVAHIAWTGASADLKDITTRIKATSVTGAK